MFGSFLPSLGCLAAIKSTQVEGADIVMKSSGFRNRRVTGVTRAGRQTSHNVISGQSPARRTRRSAVAQDYLPHGDFTFAIRSSDLLPNGIPRPWVFIGTNQVESPLLCL